MLFSLEFIEELLALGEAVSGKTRYSFTGMAVDYRGGIIFTDGESYYHALDYDGEFVHCKSMTYDEYSYLL